MKMVKSLLLGSAAGLVAVAGAHAADLPVKAKAVEYVKVCAAYGAGYFYIPGTDTCLKIGGYARFDTYFNATGTFNPMITGGAYTDRTSDVIMRARGVFDMDARTQTEYGTLRSYVRFGINSTTDTTANATGNGESQGIYFERAFIQFAGLTAGYTSSFFDSGMNFMYTTPYTKSDKWTNLIGYTAEFGNGFSATIALEDNASRSTYGGYWTAPAPDDAAGGTQIPDIVGNLRLSQAWGTAQLSAAAHQMRVALGGIDMYESSNDQWGWAIQGVLEFKLPMLAAGDSIFFTAAYADGALNYVGLSGSSTGTSQALGRVNGYGTGDALYRLADAVSDAFGSYSTSTAWSVSGQFRHFWTPGLRSAVYAGYASVDSPDTAFATANGYLDVDVWQVGVNTIWSPVKNLDIGAEVLYSKIDGSLPYNTAAAPGYGGSTDLWSGGVRVQRNF